MSHAWCVCVCVGGGMAQVYLQPLRRRRIIPESDLGQLFLTLPAIISLNKALLNAVTTNYTQTEEANRGLDAAIASLVQQKTSSTHRHCMNESVRFRAVGCGVPNLKRKECLIGEPFQQMVSTWSLGDLQN